MAPSRGHRHVLPVQEAERLLLPAASAAERAAAEKYVQTPGYSKLHDDFEASMFVHEGRLRSFNGQAYTRRELPPRPMPQEQEVSGVHVRYDGHLYQCVSTYCDNTKGLKNSQSKLRAKVMPTPARATVHAAIGFGQQDAFQSSGSRCSITKDGKQGPRRSVGMDSMGCR